jgi:hypothetical protein
MTITQSRLAATRQSLHRLAEHVVSPARHAVTGRIGLRPHPGGLRTPAFGPQDTVVAVEYDELVVLDGRSARRHRVSTLRAAGSFVGVTPGAPADVYRPATPCDLDAELHLDRAAMQVLGDWYAAGADALERLTEAVAPEAVSEAQLWPEHLDLAVTVGEVNYGVSPGDDAIPEPYAYVGPHAGRRAVDEFWNAPFGAARPLGELSDVDSLVLFFEEGARRAGAPA